MVAILADVRLEHVNVAQMGLWFKGVLGLVKLLPVIIGPTNLNIVEYHKKDISRWTTINTYSVQCGLGRVPVLQTHVDSPRRVLQSCSLVPWLTFCARGYVRQGIPPPAQLPAYLFWAATNIRNYDRIGALTVTRSPSTEPAAPAQLGTISESAECPSVLRTFLADITKKSQNIGERCSHKFHRFEK